jgi:hypothetical protein
MRYTPTSSSWMNLVERFFGELTAKAPKWSTNLYLAVEHNSAVNQVAS